MFTLRQYSDVLGPSSIEAFALNNWLRNVVDYHRLVRVTVDKLDGLRQMLFKNQDVITKSVLLQMTYAFIEILAQNEVIIRFIMDNMTHTNEFGMTGEDIQLILDTRLCKRHPTHYAAD